MAYDQAALSARGPGAALNFPVERVQESLLALALGGGAGAGAAGSPVLALKSRHSKRKRRKKSEISAAAAAAAAANDAASGRSRSKSAAAAKQQRFVVELEDLGAEYLVSSRIHRTSAPRSPTTPPPLPLPAPRNRLPPPMSASNSCRGSPSPCACASGGASRGSLWSCHGETALRRGGEGPEQPERAGVGGG
ncbi:hypothetical protein BAE44_0009447 [Dichanthelium oligosanthes]|uniref:AP2/ERF domain-containing protein n=1 Tax=Dichanthelium oligosanthes TaxID=888268 RepID=A0A1E5VWQ9_9POAL|nr:hypothetical protein BAE44_0009447 [Dichanthelium oligosanthes]